MNELEKSIKGCFDRDLSFVRFDDVRGFFNELLKFFNLNLQFWQDNGMPLSLFRVLDFLEGTLA